MTALLIQVEDILRQITPPPPQQVGCIKHRQMQHHIWGVRGEWDTAESMMLLTIDYRNAFPTLSHNFIRAALTFFSFPPTFVNLVETLRSHYHFLVGNAAIKEVTFYQEAGIGQGDPFSPQLFSFCAAVIIYPLRHLRFKMGMYLYVDDFLITFGRETTKQQLRHVFHELRRFSAVSGLQQNVGKSAYVTKGALQPGALQFMQHSGLQHETKVRYLGVQMRHV